MPPLPPVDATWTLFLDRDGVINHEKDNDYVYHFGEFTFYDGVKEALHLLAALFGRVVMVTNQRGVAKNLMTEQDLQDIHSSMLAAIVTAGGRIDQIYYATSLLDDHPDRKPNTGMAFSAKKDFTEIDFRRSIIVGNTISDMQFGKNAGMYTVYLTTTRPGQSFPHPLIDFRFHSLYDFAKALHNT